MRYTRNVSFEELFRKRSCPFGRWNLNLKRFKLCTTPSNVRRIFSFTLQVSDATNPGHEWVHNIGRVLHRDISMNNVMFRRIGGEVYGVLNDFDLATCIDDLDRIPTSKYRTGTRPFMAYEQHDINWNGPPHYRHDAESFFYLILILGCN